MHGFKIWVPEEQTYAATPYGATLRVPPIEAHLHKYDAEFFDVTKAHGQLLWPIAELGELILSPPAEWASRHPGKLRRARRVIPGDRRAQQLWQVRLAKLLASLLLLLSPSVVVVVKVVLAAIAKVIWATVVGKPYPCRAPATRGAPGREEGAPRPVE